MSAGRADDSGDLDSLPMDTVSANPLVSVPITMLVATTSTGIVKDDADSGNLDLPLTDLVCADIPAVGVMDTDAVASNKIGIVIKK